MCVKDEQGNKTKDCGMCNCGSSDKAGSHPAERQRKVREVRNDATRDGLSRRLAPVALGTWSATPPVPREGCSPVGRSPAA